MNIAQAFKQLGRIDEARDVVRRMQAMGWAPLAATLAALDADIMAAAPAKQDEGVPEVGWSRSTARSGRASCGSRTGCGAIRSSATIASSRCRPSPTQM